MLGFSLLYKGRGLPKKNLIFYSLTPNNWLDVGWEGDFGWDSDLSTWSLPVACYDAVSADTFWFSDSATPVVRTGAEIVAWAGTNNWNVLFSLTRGLAVYSLDAPLEIINKARRYFNSSTTPLPAIYPTLAWGLKSSAELTSRYGPDPTFVSAGLTPDGIGGTYQSNVLPVDKTYNDVYVGVGYGNLLTPAPTAPATLTLTAQKYCLQCFDSGSVSCSYGTATPGAPLIFTAIAGTTTFTPTSCGEWMLTASGGYVFPRIAHGTSVVSCAGSVGGNGLSWLMDAKTLESLRGKIDGVELVSYASGIMQGAGGVTYNTAIGVCTCDGLYDYQGIQYPTVITSGKRYLVDYEVIAKTSGKLFFGSTGFASPTEITSAVGRYKIEVLAIDNDQALKIVGLTGASRFAGSLKVHSVQKLLPSKCTVATLVRMGVSSASITGQNNILSENGSVSSLIFTDVGGTIKSNDGTNTASVTVSGGWLAGDRFLIVRKTNATGTKMILGAFKIGTSTSVQWGAESNYDGSSNPLTSVRAGVNRTAPGHIGCVELWDRPVPDATILDWGINRL